VRSPRIAAFSVGLLALALAVPARAQQPAIVRIDDPNLPTTPIHVDTLWTVGRNTMYGVDSVFQLIAGLAVDSTGAVPRILVLDARDAVLRVFDMNGKFLAKVGRQGEGPGEFRFPTALDVSSNGHIFVCDIGLGRITEFENDLKPIRTVRPGVAVGGVYNMIVLEHEIVIGSATSGGPDAVNVIHVFDRETGEHIRSFGALPPAPSERVSRLIGVGRLRLAKDGSLWYTYVAPYIIENYTLDGKLRRRIERPAEWLPPAGDAFEVTMRGTRTQITNHPFASSLGVLELPDGHLLHQVRLPDGREVLDWYDSEGHLLNSAIAKMMPLNVALGNDRFLVAGGGPNETAWFGMVQLRH
jgi:hypothetical protein